MDDAAAPEYTARLGLDNFAGLMEQQLEILRRIDQRQAAADLSTQPIPQVPATSSSTWGALLQSRVADAIQPKVDRWRSGLDALLVFLGLFSGIVTAFLVNSLAGLQPDEVARTNELLVNLTEIVIQLSGSPTLKVADPAPFEPDVVSVRLELNSYWSISLILSLSVAALAVACRGFLNMVVLSNHKRAVDRLIDINRRWKGAEKMLGPAVEAIPQLLVIPVILFVVGLLDSIFSAILALHPLPVPIAAASALSLLFVIGIVAFLAAALLHAALWPASSPFQSSLARFVRRSFTAATTPREKTDFAPTYHEMVQATHDDDTLDKAAAALFGVLESRAHWDPSGQHYALVHGSGATLAHLLSPEASPRCNHTAAQVIVFLAPLFDQFNLSKSLALTQLPDHLASAARRSANYRSLAVLWSSNYIHALAIVAGVSHPAHPPVISLLGSKFTSRGTTDFLLGIFFAYYDEHAASSDGPPPRAMIQLFEPPSIDALQVLTFAPYLVHTGRTPRARLLIALLLRAKSPARILELACDLFLPDTDAARREDPQDASAVLIAQLVIDAYLGLAADSDVDVGADARLADLCTACTAHIKARVESEGRTSRFMGALCAIEAAVARFPSIEREGENGRWMTGALAQLLPLAGVGDAEEPWGRMDFEGGYV